MKLEPFAPLPADKYPQVPLLSLTLSSLSHRLSLDRSIVYRTRIISLSLSLSLSHSHVSVSLLQPLVDLVHSMLAVDVHDRPSAKQIVDNEW
jgi:hypothetical protein